MSTTRKPLLVQKFGGTSLADLKGFDASAKVIARYVDEYRVIVVLSAVKGVTDLLLAAIDVLDKVVLEAHPVDGVEVSLQHVRIVRDSGATDGAVVSDEARLQSPELGDVLGDRHVLRVDVVTEHTTHLERLAAHLTDIPAQN